jgi:acetyltransferase-like isoleucine patch superfamily enzyme
MCLCLESTPVNPRLALGTATTLARLKLRGIGAGLVTSEGRNPIIHSGGIISLGRVALRGTTAAVELGAQPGGRLTIGDRVFINQGVTLVAHHDITVGDDCRIGDYVAIYDTDHHAVDQETPVRSAPVRIGRNVWIARGAIVMPGVTIGDHSVVAAASVVTADVPPRTLVAGNPARAVRELTAADRWRRD